MNPHRVETDGFCAVCGNDPDNGRALNNHHLLWEPEFIMPVCTGCHNRINVGKGLEHYRPPTQPSLKERRRRYGQLCPHSYPDKRKNRVRDKAKRNAWQREYMKRNPEQRRKNAEYTKKWLEDHPEKKAEYNRRYRGG